MTINRKEPAVKKGYGMRLKIRLVERLNNLFAERKERDEVLAGLEELLISSDFGTQFSTEIIGELKKNNASKKEDFITGLKRIIKDRISIEKPSLDSNNLNAMLVFGVNGTGKTSTVGKLAYMLKSEGKRVLIAAADTHRDAAIDQLLIWSKKAGVPVIKQYQGSDPGAVVFDACDAALSRQVDNLIIDTAGRLHNKERLMEELSKIGRILKNKLPHANRLRFLTLDATTGQNALSQAIYFKQYVGVDGIILTKLDSSAKGGIACSVSNEMKIPILYASIGERVHDLIEFRIDEYLDMLFS